MAGFEPAISCCPRHAEYQAFLHPACEPETNRIAGENHRRTESFRTLKSAQRESNPHFRHGKATGCRYIMGALWCAELSMNNRAPGETRTLVAALRVRYPRRWTTSAINHFSGTRGT